MEALAFEPVHWEMPIDNITFIYEPFGEVGSLKFHLPAEWKMRIFQLLAQR